MRFLGEEFWSEMYFGQFYEKLFKWNYSNGVRFYFLSEI